MVSFQLIVALLHQHSFPFMHVYDREVWDSQKEKFMDSIHFLRLTTANGKKNGIKTKSNNDYLFPGTIRRILSRGKIIPVFNLVSCCLFCRRSPVGLKILGIKGIPRSNNNNS